jgi:hypothetical protein
MYLCIIFLHTYLKDGTLVSCNQQVIENVRLTVVGVAAIRLGRLCKILGEMLLQRYAAFSHIKKAACQFLQFLNSPFLNTELFSYVNDAWVSK